MMEQARAAQCRVIIYVAALWQVVLALMYNRTVERDSSSTTGHFSFPTVKPSQLNSLRDDTLVPTAHVHSIAQEAPYEQQKTNS